MPGYTKFHNHLAAYEPNFFVKRVPQSLPQLHEPSLEASRLPLLAKFIEAHRSLEEHKYVVQSLREGSILVSSSSIP